MITFLLDKEINQGQAYGSIAALVDAYPLLSIDGLWKKYQRLKDKSMPFYEDENIMIWKSSVIRKPKSK